MNAIASALAHGPATASHETSDVAKTREGKGPHHTTPQGKFLVAEFPSWRLVSDARDRDEMMTLRAIEAS